MRKLYRKLGALVIVCSFLTQSVSVIKAAEDDVTNKINVGETKTVSIVSDEDKVYYKFIPEKSGVYELESDNGGDYANIDPYVYVYDSNWELLGSNEDISEDDFNFYYEFKAEADKTYYIALGCNDNNVEYDFTLNEAAIDEIAVNDVVYVKTEDSKDKVYYKFTTAKNTRYILKSYDGNVDDNDPWVNVYDSSWNLIGESDDEDQYQRDFYLEFSADANETYYIELGGKQDYNCYYFTLTKNVKITHQPTLSEPYVSVEGDEVIEYKWYKLQYKEITDKDVYETDSTYDTQKGWSTKFYNGEGYEKEYYMFTLPLKKGETVKVKFSKGCNEGMVGICKYETNFHSGIYKDCQGSDTYTLTVDEDGDYTLFAYPYSADISLKAYVKKLADTPIAGETKSTLTNPIEGETYICKMTFSDGIYMWSDVLGEIEEFPETGDNLYLIMAIMLLAMAYSVTYMIIRKKKYKECR